MKQVRGDCLQPIEQSKALSRYIHRFTGDHRPNWVTDETVTPVQFANDRDWLEHTFFWVTKHGRLANNHKYCESRPTWPHNPELRQ